MQQRVLTALFSALKKTIRNISNTRRQSRKRNNFERPRPYANQRNTHTKRHPLRPPMVRRSHPVYKIAKTNNEYKFNRKGNSFKQICWSGKWVHGNLQKVN